MTGSRTRHDRQRDRKSTTLAQSIINLCILYTAFSASHCTSTLFSAAHPWLWICQSNVCGNIYRAKVWTYMWCETGFMMAIDIWYDALRSTMTLFSPVHRPMTSYRNSGMGERVPNRINKSPCWASNLSGCRALRNPSRHRQSHSNRMPKHSCNHGLLSNN